MINLLIPLDLNSMINSVGTTVSGVAGAVAIVALACVGLLCIIKQDIRAALSKTGAVLLGIMVIAAATSIVAAITAVGQSIK